ncbi:MAG TPA: hypothetical protein PKH39_18550 [Woeseiaceae bacterium]|nr:hypothetical protein [Woeseiaceae bacterium]
MRKQLESQLAAAEEAYEKSSGELRKARAVQQKANESVRKLNAQASDDVNAVAALKAALEKMPAAPAKTPAEAPQ